MVEYLKRQSLQNIPVLNHTLNLPPHSQKHQNQPVHHQNGPEDGQVEDLTPAAGESDAHGASGRVPELELREAADEGLELLVALGGERRCARRHAVLHIRVRLKAGVEFGRDEGEEEVEEVDSEGVGDCGRIVVSFGLFFEIFWLVCASSLSCSLCS